MDILLIRHGQSVANEMGLLISNDQDGLTQAGVVQSEKLAEKLAALGYIPETIYSSPWARAKTTALTVFDQRSAKIHYDTRLAETHPGIYGAWQEKEFNRQFPDFYNDLNRQYEGGESHMDMAKRVCNWVDTEVLPKQHAQGLLAVVAHGGPIPLCCSIYWACPLSRNTPALPYRMPLIQNWFGEKT